MPQLAPIVLKNGAGESFTFSPRQMKDGASQLVSGTGIPLGDRKLTISLNRTSTGRPKAGVKIAVPTVANGAGPDGVAVPKVVRSAYAELTLSYDPSHSAKEREDLVWFLLYALQDPLSWKVITGLEDLY